MQDQRTITRSHRSSRRYDRIHTSPGHQVSALLRVFGSPLPRVRVSTQMQHGEYTNEVYVGRKEDAVREIADERSSSAFLSRSLANTVFTCASKRKPRPGRSRS